MELGPSASGVAASMAAALLLVGIAGLAMGNHYGRSWLVVLFGINAGYGDVSKDSLRTVYPADILLLFLTGVIYTGFWPGPGAGYVWWMILAIAQPALGIAILLATRLWGRSGLIGGALVLSILMLVSGGAWTVGGWVGVTASVLLLVSDFATTGRPSRPLALALTIGYAALVIWFGWIAAVLLA